MHDFVRFTYKVDNFRDLKNYCEDNGIWICQALGQSGENTSALVKDKSLADKLSAQFG